uniref:18 kDa Sin3-associated polypeptide n=1 Tax=Plectus sambesii TaxID=2011161 RepID=A0A914WIB0_9BILA
MNKSSQSQCIRSSCRVSFFPLLSAFLPHPDIFLFVKQNAFISTKLNVSPDRMSSRYAVREIGNTCNGNRGVDDNKTLAQCKFEIGDFIDVAISIPGMPGPGGRRDERGGPPFGRERPSYGDRSFGDRSFGDGGYPGGGSYRGGRY